MKQKDFFKKKSTYTTDVEGMCTCGDCKFSIWNRWVWYCVHPDIPHEIAYGTIDKYMYCNYFLKRPDKPYTIVVPADHGGRDEE
jgi:hypothetical protein